MHSGKHSNSIAEWKHSNSILSPSLWQTIGLQQKLGVLRTYQNDALHVFLRVKDVITGYKELKLTCPEDFQPIFNYFEDNYIEWYNSTGQRQKPRFANERGSCCKRIKKGYSRTNKSIESWNSNFVKLIHTKHLSLPKLFEKFKDGQKNQTQWWSR